MIRIRARRQSHERRERRRRTWEEGGRQEGRIMRGTSNEEEEGEIIDAHGRRKGRRESRVEIACVAVMQESQRGERELGTA